MTQNTLTHPADLDVQAALPLLRLLNPKQYTRDRAGLCWELA